MVVEWPLRGIKPPSAASSSAAARGICNGNEERGGEGRGGRKKEGRSYNGGERKERRRQDPPLSHLRWNSPNDPME